MVRKTQEEALKTRDAILQAAIEAFVEKGVGNASLEMIAEKAGVTRGAVYWHFESKAAIFHALYDQLHTPFIQVIIKGLEIDHPQPLDQLEQLCTEQLLDVSRLPQKKKLLSVFLLKCDYSCDMRAVLDLLTEQQCENIKVLSRYFDRARDKGHLAKACDSHILSLSLICYLRGIVQEYLYHPVLFDYERQVPLLISQFFDGVRKQSGVC